MPCSRAASINANAVASSSPRPNSSGAEPMPPKFPQPSASTDTRMSVPASRAYCIAAISGLLQLDVFADPLRLRRGHDQRRGSSILNGHANGLVERNILNGLSTRFGARDEFADLGVDVLGAD